MTWFLFSLTSIFALATAELTQQYILNKEQAISARTSAVITFLIQALFTLPAIFLLGIQDQILVAFQTQNLKLITFTSFVASFGMIFYLKSFEVKNISISTIFIASSAIVSTIMGIIVFNETTTLFKFIGTFLILAAIVYVNLVSLDIEKNHFYGLLAGFLFGITFTVDKQIVATIDPVVYIFVGFLLISIFGALFGAKQVFKDVKTLNFDNLKPVLLSGIGYVIYNWATFRAYQEGGEVGRVDAINNSQIFLIILFEYIFLMHRKNAWRKIFAALLAFSGVIILGFF